MKRVLSFVSIGLAITLLSPFVAGAAAKNDVVRPGESIQAAIDAADPGDTIVVKRGVYRESLQIDEDGITLKGKRAKLLPPDSPPQTLCNSFGPTTGICIVGQINPETFEVERAVQDVRVTGFSVRGFDGDGMFTFGTDDLRIERNKTLRNGGYGIFSLSSTGTRHLHNFSARNGDAGLYIGDSPDSGAVVRRNVAIGNQGPGIFLRSATNGRAVGNVLAGNCEGILVLGNAPGPAADWTLARNKAFANNRFCPGEEEGDPALSGIGIGLADADRVVVRGNKVIANRPSGDVDFSGGVVVVGGSDNTVRRNIAFRNAPADLFATDPGAVEFRQNRCGVSIPDGSC